MRGRRGWWVVGGLATIAVAAHAATAVAARRTQRIEQALEQRGPATEATAGTERLILRGDSDAKFEVAASGLTPRSAHDVILHGIRIGTFTTSGRGGGKLRFRTRARGRVRPLGFEPRGLPLEIRNASGTIVLAGTLPEIDPNAAACCLPEETTCAMMATDACAAAGGLVPDTRSCLPNPCDERPAAPSFVCCLPCGDPAPCEFRSEAECLAEDGFVIEGDSCDPNPCAPSKPLQTQCCVMDGDQQFFSKCEVRTPDECAMAGGIDMGEGLCDPSPCEVP